MKNFLFSSILTLLCLIGLSAMAQTDPPIVLKSYAFYPGKWVNDELTYPSEPEEKEFLFMLFDQSLRMNDRDDTRFYFVGEMETRKEVADDGDPFSAMIVDAVSSIGKRLHPDRLL